MIAVTLVAAPQVMALQQTRLVAADGAEHDRFGSAIALSGDTALVAARSADPGGRDSQGAVYVFTRDGGTWKQRAKLVAEDGDASDQFGWSVTLSGDTALVGALRADAGRGAAYVFARDGGTWYQRAKLAADDGARGDAFGISVALSDDTALVGANTAAVDGDARPGAAYLFTRRGDDWSRRGTLTADDEAKRDVLDLAVALSGATALLGAQGADVNGAVGQGAAYVFAHQATSRTP